MISDRGKRFCARLTLLLVVGAAACGESSRPELVSLSPSTVIASELPLPVLALGRNLEPAVTLSLNDGQRARVGPVEVRIGATRIAQVEFHSKTEIQFIVPTGVAPGIYDIELLLGKDRNAKLADAFTVQGVMDGGVLTASTSIPEPSAPLSMKDGGAPPFTITPARCAVDAFSSPEAITIEGLDDSTLGTPSLAADNRTLYFTAPSGQDEGIWYATRSDRGAAFTTATELPHFTSHSSQGSPWISVDQLSLYYYAGDYAIRDLYVSARTKVNDAFPQGVIFTELNSTIGVDHWPWLSPDELTIVFRSVRQDTSSEIWTATRASKSAPFSAPATFSTLDSLDSSESRTVLTADSLRAYFVSSRIGGVGSDDIWYAERDTPAAEFGAAQNLGAVNSTENDSDVFISLDSEELFFVRLSGAPKGMYRALANCP